MVRDQEFMDLTEMDRRDVLSVFLDVDPRKPEHQAAKPAYVIWLRNALRDALAGLEGQARKQAHEAARRILAHVEATPPRRARGRGLAIFAGPGLWREHVLPVPLANRVRYGAPDVTPLLDVNDEYRPYAILAVGHEHARILVAYLGTATVVDEDALELHTDEWRFKAGRPPTFTRLVGVGAGRGADQEGFQARVEHHQREFWAGVSKAVADLLRDRAIDRLIISGPEEAVHAVRESLPDPARAAVVGVVPLSANAALSEIQERTLPVALDAEHRRDAELVKTVVDRAGSGGVLGKQATLDALVRGQVQTLVVDRAAFGVMETLPGLARRMGSRIELVGEPAAAGLRRYDGVGGILRYPAEREATPPPPDSTTG